MPDSSKGEYRKFEKPFSEEIRASRMLWKTLSFDTMNTMNNWVFTEVQNYARCYEKKRKLNAADENNTYEDYINYRPPCRTEEKL